METQENYLELYLKIRESSNIETYPFYKHQFRELAMTLSEKYGIYDEAGVICLIDYWMELLRQIAKKRYIDWIEKAFLPLTNKDYEEFLKYVKETEIDDIFHNF